MIPGYNHNVKYKDRVYHVQTEDSGVQNPHIITHLFVGGNIVESRKTSYAELVGSDRLSAQLVDLMQGQHKGMLKDLINGRFDEKIVERSKNAATLNGPAPLNVDAGAQNRASFGIGGDGPAKTAPAAAATKATAPATTAPRAIPAAPLPAATAARPVAPPAPTTSRPVQPSPFAQAPKPPPGRFATPPAVPKPPPLPATPVAAPATPAARPTASPARAPAPPSAAQAGPPTFGAPPPARTSVIPPAAAVPAAITRPVPPPAPIAVAPQTQTAAELEASGMVIEAEALARAFESKDESAVDSIFGEDLISEKSLDEVILSYLADDMQKE